MAFVSVPKDLSRIKSRLVLNMSLRQLVCFGSAVVVGVPTYIITRAAIGNSAAVLLMMGLMLPMFFLAMYEKDGQPAEIVLRNIIRTRFYWHGIRPYKTENMYEILDKEAKSIAIRMHERAERKAFDQLESTATTKTSVSKRKAGKGKLRRHEKVRARKK